MNKNWNFYFLCTPSSNLNQLTSHCQNMNKMVAIYLQIVSVNIVLDNKFSCDSSHCFQEVELKITKHLLWRKFEKKNEKVGKSFVVKPILGLKRTNYGLASSRHSEVRVQHSGAFGWSAWTGNCQIELGWERQKFFTCVLFFIFYVNFFPF